MKQLERWALGLLALVAFLAPLKFGTAVVLQWRETPPVDLYGWLVHGWPTVFGVMLVMAGTLVWATGNRVWMQQRDLLYWLPAVWLVTQMAAAFGSVHRQMSMDIVLHAGTCVVLFYAAAWHARDGAAAVRVFQGLGWAALVLCVMALDQKYGFLTGGFEATGEWVTQWYGQTDDAAQMRAKLESARVFGSFGGYPNALAAYLALVIGPMLGWLLTRARLWSAGFKWALLGFVGVVMAWCFWLAGSRGGFVALTAVSIAGGTALALTKGGTRKRSGLTLAGLAAGALVLFAVLGATGNLPRGAGSALSRFDYWGGAIEIGKDYPWFGTGPGTFGSVYPVYKTADTEEAKTVHNDFLQMWSDSGWMAMFVYAAIWIVGLRDAVRLVRARGGDAASVGLLMFVAGWSVHSVIDFDLYVPGLAWPAFLMLGMVQGLKDLVPLTGTSEARGPRLLAQVASMVLVAVVMVYGARMWRAASAYGRAHEIDVERRTMMPLDYRQKNAARAFGMAPSVAHYALTAGDLAMENRDFVLAERYYRHAIAEDRFRWFYHRRLADAQLAQGRERDALESLRRALELNRRHPGLQRAIDQLSAKP